MFSVILVVHFFQMVSLFSKVFLGKVCSYVVPVSSKVLSSCFRVFLFFFHRNTSKNLYTKLTIFTNKPETMSCLSCFPPQKKTKWKIKGFHCSACSCLQERQGNTGKSIALILQKVSQKTHRAAQLSHHPAQRSTHWDL